MANQTHIAPTAKNELAPFTIYTLRNEDAERAEKFVNDVLELFKPQDVVVRGLVCQYARNAWMVERYDRFEALAIERRVQQSREYRAQRAKELKRRRESRIAELATNASEGPADIARVVALDRNIDAAPDDIDAILHGPPQDAEYLRALENSLETLEKFDFLKGRAIKQRNEAIELIELWNAGLGKALREVTQQVLDAEFKEVPQTLPEVEAPPLAAEKEEDDDAHEGEAAGEPQQ
jgi:hypothetical protein